MEHKELALEKKARNHARASGWIACKLEKNGHKGIPDDLFISPDGDRVLLVEFKRDANQTPRPEQLRWAARFPQLVHLCGTFADFVKLIEPTT